MSVTTQKTVVIYHYPRCSKSREALELLHAQDVQPQVILYRETPPDAASLRQLLAKLKPGSVREVMRTKETCYSALQLDDATLSEQALFEALLANPQLLERPIVVVGEKACIARPAEKILAIL